MSPKDGIEQVFREAVLDLAADLPFARKLVNSGRLSRPCSLEGFPLQTPAVDGDGLAPGMPCVDAPVANGKAGWLLNHLGGDFTLLSVGAPPIEGPRGLRQVAVDDRQNGSALIDTEGHVGRRYGHGNVYLVRPDQHIAARFAHSDASAVGTALDRATARSAT